MILKRISQELWGAFLYRLCRMGLYKQPAYSRGIADDLTRGYGELDENGYWQYPIYKKGGWK